MKLTFKYALSAAFCAALVTPAFAQDGYPDVKDNHWAYEALLRLKKEGLLVGYPDGNFYGKKLPTRYELASAIYAVYMNLKNVTDGLDAKIAALESKVNGMGGSNSNAGGNDQEMKDALQALRNDVNSYKAWGDEIAALRKLTDGFQKELTSLGVDVEAIKKDLTDLDSRVKALEGKKSSINISGDLNFFVSAGFAADGGFGINQDGRGFGFGVNNSQGAGIQDLSVLHEAALTLSGTNETGPKWSATILYGNTVGGGFGDQASVAGQFGALYTEGATNFVIQNAVVDLGSQSLVGLGFTARIGRQGYKVSPWIFQRLDNTSFFNNSRWDNGEWLLDGAVLGFGNKTTKLDIVFGRTSQNNGTNATLQPIVVGAEQLGQGFSGGNGFAVFGDAGVVNQLGGGLQADRIAAANFSTKLGNKGSLTAAFVRLDSDQRVGPNAINRADISGVDANFAVTNSISITAGAGQVDLLQNDTKINNGANKRFNAGASYSSNKFNVKGQYLRVEQSYFAPGDWGRVGIFRNVTNVKGFTADADYKVSDKFTLTAGTAQLEQLAGGNGKIRQFIVGADLNLNNGWNLGLSYEDARLTDYAAVNPTYKFTTARLGYNLSAASTLSIMAQYADVQGHPFAPAGATPIGVNGSAKGLYLGTQLSVKF